MILQSSDGRRSLDVGSGELTRSILSTVEIRLERLSSSVPLAIAFLKSGACSTDDAQETARQVNLVRDALAQVPPELAVYDQTDLSKQAPWSGKLSPVITSCGNLYITADGKDFLFELVSILAYASVLGVSVTAFE